MEFDVAETGTPELVVSVEEQKLFSRVDNDEEDALIEQLIRGVTQEAEDITHRAFAPRAVVLSADLPAETAELPVLPVLSVDSVKVDGEDVLPETFALAVPSSQRKRSRPAVFVPLDGFPEEGRLEIAVTVGTSHVPDPVVTWIKTRVSTLYEQRESHAMFNTGLKFVEMSRDYALALLDPYIVHGGF
jgi:uncharacterized phiE125 gp8 family phage protein